MNTQFILFTVIFSAAFYILAAIFLSFKKTLNFAPFFWIGAFLGNAALVANNWIINGYVPFVSMYQVLTFLSLIFGGIFLYVKFFYDGKWMARYFCIAPAICLIGVCFMGIGTVWSFPPALQSVWFVPHVLVYMISYSLCAVAFILVIVRFFDKKNSSRINTGIYALVKTAFPFMTMGMFFGAIWANDVWCGFWSFDMKENWSLLTWLMFANYLHFKRCKSLNKYSEIFVVSGFCGIVVTMFCVGFMGGASPHAYSM